MIKEITTERPIKSFIRRGRPLTSGQRLGWDTLWPQYGLPLGEPLDWPATFGRQQRRVLEIGFGTGRGLLTLAQQNPDTDYVGIEVHRPGVASVLLGIQEAQITNLRLYWGDAVSILNECIAAQSLDEVLLFFPDPWPKKRHHKRRLVQVPFVESVALRLKKNGVFHMATDWEDYARHMQAVMKQLPQFSLIETSLPGEPSRPSSKYAERGQQLGHTLHDMLFCLSS